MELHHSNMMDNIKTQNKDVFAEDRVDRDAVYDKEDMKLWHERNSSDSSPTEESFVDAGELASPDNNAIYNSNNSMHSNANIGASRSTLTLSQLRRQQQHS